MTIVDPNPIVRKQRKPLPVSFDEVDVMAMIKTLMRRRFPKQEADVAALTAHWLDDQNKRVHELRWAVETLQEVAKKVERRVKQIRYG
jgi:hypothetical protein